MKELNLIDKLDAFRKSNYNFREYNFFKEFNLYFTENRNIRIRVFEDFETMYSMSCGEDFDGMFSPCDTVYDHEGNFKRFEKGSQSFDKCMGFIYLHKDKLGTRIISHELTHAVLNFFRTEYVGFYNHIQECEMDYEECFCYMLGDCLSALYKCLYDEKIL